MSDDFWDQQYDLQRRDYVFWLFGAQKLKRAADLCWAAHAAGVERVQAAKTDDELIKAFGHEDFGIAEIYFFLAALVVENVAKAVLIARDPERFSDSKKLSHDLLAYVRECGVALPPEREQLIQLLRTSIEWSGRYPVPKSRNQWKLQEDRSPAGVIAPARRPEVEQLIEDLIAKLPPRTSETAHDQAG